MKRGSSPNWEEEIDAEAAEEFLHFADMNGLRHFFKRRFHRNISLDRSELVGKVCHVFSGSELLSLCALDFIDMRIEIVERLVLRQKLQRCLFADARTPGMLSAVSPMSAFMSMTWDGVMPYFSSTAFGVISDMEEIPFCVR